MIALKILCYFLEGESETWGRGSCHQEPCNDVPWLFVAWNMRRRRRRNFILPDNFVDMLYRQWPGHWPARCGFPVSTTRAVLCHWSQVWWRHTRSAASCSVCLLVCICTGSDPATDLRGVGLLSLVHLLYFVTEAKCQQLSRSVYKLSLHHTQARLSYTLYHHHHHHHHHHHLNSWPTFSSYLYNRV